MRNALVLPAADRPGTINGKTAVNAVVMDLRLATGVSVMALSYVINVLVQEVFMLPVISVVVRVHMTIIHVTLAMDMEK